MEKLCAYRPSVNSAPLCSHCQYASSKEKASTDLEKSEASQAFLESGALRCANTPYDRYIFSE